MVKLIDEKEESGTINVKVVGVGNAGSNIVSRISGKIEGVSFVVFNTDINALKYAKADVKKQIGEKTTHGRGTGRDPEKGKFAANEDRDKISDVLRNANIVFLVAGLGGGTGTGSSPVIAKIAKDLQAIVIAIVTTPFEFEGEKRVAHAKKGIDVLESNVDTLIHIPNQRLFDVVDEKVSMPDAFGKVDSRIQRTVASLSDLIYKQKILDIDFADICSIVENAGRGIVGLGRGEGEGRMETAARTTIDDPLIEKSDMMEAKNILISITGGSDITLKEVKEGMDLIQSRIACPSKILGVTIDPQLENEVKITLLATGISGGRPRIEGVFRKSPEKPQGELPLVNGDDEGIDTEVPTFLRRKDRGIL